MAWNSTFGLDFEYSPVLTCVEMVEMQQEHNAKLDALTCEPTSIRLIN